MNWEQIAGHESLKSLLKDSVKNNRVSHAQLFVGKEGYGALPLALAYAQEILQQENPQAAAKVSHLNHIDLHFSFPVFTDNKNSLSKLKFEEFREMILANPYASFEDWSSLLESVNRQLFISVEEINDKNQIFSLKSYEGGTKILIIWLAEKMNVMASNKLLKFLEEPPEKTVILLIAENIDFILPTILSRTQIIEVPRIAEEDLINYLISQKNVTEEQAKSVTHEAQGDLNVALKLLETDRRNPEFEVLFVQWVREAFKVKKKPEYLRNIILWAREIAGWNREKQKNFLEYASEIFRLALLQNYQSSDLVYKKINDEKFNWEGFSQYISGANIISILDEINNADLHLTRNGNAKVVWTDLGIKLSRYIHKTA